MFIPDPNFFHSRSEFFHPGSWIRIKESILTQKLVVSKLSEFDPGWSSRILIPDPDTDFLPIPDPGVIKNRIPDPERQHCF